MLQLVRSFLVFALLFGALLPDAVQGQEEGLSTEAPASPEPMADRTEDTSPEGSTEARPAGACAPIPAPTLPVAQRRGSYEGPFFDTHFHIEPLRTDMRGQPALASADALCQYLEQDGVLWALGFYSFPPSTSPRTSRPTALFVPLVEGARQRVIPLLNFVADPGRQFHDPQSSAFVQGDYSEAVLQSYFWPTWAFRGVGEIAMADPVTMSFAMPAMQTALRPVAASKGIVMAHLAERLAQHPAPIRSQYMEALEAAIRNNPDVTFLFHGHTGNLIFDVTGPLMTRYPNVFLTWDVAQFLNGSWGDLMRPTGSNPGGSSAQFVADVRRVGTARIVAETAPPLASILERYPDRVMWATDRRAPWNFDAEAASLMMDVSRQLVGQLPPEHQENYAYRNALRAFGKYLASP